MVSAGIAVAPVTDWRYYDTRWTEAFMKRPEDNPEGYERTSHALRAKRLHGRLLLIHGTYDDNVHPQNTWVSSMTVAELRRIWEEAAQGKVTRWNHVRPDWPDQELHLFGPGTASGTFDYFTEAINGTAKSSRGDYTASESDNVLVQGVSTDVNSLGYFGLAYYEHNRDKLKLVPIDDENPDNGAGPVLPSMETVRNGTYRPLSRPLFIYVNLAAMARPEVQQFVDTYFSSPALMQEVGYVELTPQLYDLAKQHFAERRLGTAFGAGGSQVGVTLEQLLTREQ